MTQRPAQTKAIKMAINNKSITNAEPSIIKGRKWFMDKKVKTTN